MPTPEKQRLEPNALEGLKAGLHLHQREMTLRLSRDDRQLSCATLAPLSSEALSTLSQVEAFISLRKVTSAQVTPEGAQGRHMILAH